MLKSIIKKIILKLIFTNIALNEYTKNVPTATVVPIVIVAFFISSFASVSVSTLISVGHNTDIQKPFNIHTYLIISKLVQTPTVTFATADASKLPKIIQRVLYFLQRSPCIT